VNELAQQGESLTSVYYRRWKNPWTYAIYCRDDRRVPIIEL
jgi:hypothetical protein